MDFGAIKDLADAIGPTPAFIVALIGAIMFLFPILKRERQQSKEAVSLITDREVLEFMARHDVRWADLDRRISKLEDRLED